MKSPVQIRNEAEKIVRAFKQAAEIRSRIAAFNADAAAKLAALDSEISELEGRADGEDAGLIQQLVITRERRARLAEKQKRDAAEFRASVEREAQAAVAGMNFGKFFADAFELESEKATAAFAPFFETEQRASGAAGQCDSVNALFRWRGLLSQIPPEAIAKRLEKFVSGECPLFRI